jgi:hypothetical protein
MVSAMKPPSVVRRPEDQRRIERPKLTVKLHDAARIEWIATVPLPRVGERRRYRVVLDATVNDSLWTAHKPWEHFSIRSRLDSPKLDHDLDISADIDSVRRHAQAVVHDIKEATGVLRRRAMAIRRPSGRAEQELCALLETRLDRIHFALSELDALNHADVAVAHEVRLAYDYGSTQVLAMVTRLRREEPSPRVPLAHGDGLFALALRDVVNNEQARRLHMGFAVPVHGDEERLQAFLDRSALLKRHFQQVLYLDAKAYMVDERYGNVAAVFAAVLASSWYFVWQMYYLNAAMSSSQTTVSLLMAGGVAGLLYAVKDRIKELARRAAASWLKNKWADRFVSLRLQERMSSNVEEVAVVRETIRVQPDRHSDPLNPELGATRKVVRLELDERFESRGLLHVEQLGIRALKHVFRYDFSELVRHVDDQPKRVPIVNGGEVTLIGVRRRYLVPIRVRLYDGDDRNPLIEQTGTIIIRGRKLRAVRLAPRKESFEPAAPVEGNAT